MSNSRKYPNYHFYDNKKLKPSVLAQQFPLPTLAEEEVYYPENLRLKKYFSTSKEHQKFGAAQFCNFLSDTIEVEHCLVIPAIVGLRRLPYDIPAKPMLDLFKTATDEGFHAEQAYAYLNDLEEIFDIRHFPASHAPLFLRRLEYQKNRLASSTYRNLTDVLNGIVTETRISIELSHFAVDHSL